ncbi:DMT family transporter [Galactobacter sp.]|uniref:DMT family transporter n=1 Tax=Galactobacter sp. TaxID=2676125 RepID=UPI0025BFD81D|nr:DMT family transporter [Galactobacter sp.]
MSDAPSLKQPSSGPSIPLPLGLLLAAVAGLAIPVQSRVNSELGASLDDGLAAALVSFSTGLVLIGLIAVIFPVGRRSMKQIPQALRSRAFPVWYMLAGAIGAYFVLAQGIVAGVLGVAVFTIANVTGQSIGSIVVDGTGFGPGGKRPITGLRILGTLLTLVAVGWAVSPKLGGALEDPWALILPMLLPFSAGILNGFQTAMNGRQTHYYGTFIPATVFNFVAGTLILGVAFLIKLGVAGAPEPLPTQPLFYVGGACGVIFISLSAYLSKHLGVLLTSLGMIAGQLIGSLVLDVVVPAPGAHVALATVLGSLLAIVAVSLASIPTDGSLRRRK